MHLHSLTLTNVRQFDQRFFKFQPGFNLLVGENGAGKTTILRGMLAALGSAQQMGRRPRLEDNDIRLRTDFAEISAIVCHVNDAFEEFQFRKALWKPATRSANRAGSPLILLYSSNEATCSAMKAKPAKRIGDFYSASVRQNEEFLYASERNFSREAAPAVAGRQFGSSQSVRKFVKKVLLTFSPDMGEFFWRFEPYDCSIVLPENAERTPLTAELQKQARAFAMRWFAEWSIRRKRPIDWPDQEKIALAPNAREPKRGDRNLPDIREIWEGMRIGPADRKLLLSCSLEVSLTPRIMIQRKIGTFNLSQLSDGEQRLFSLFVDIARQLSINDKKDEKSQSGAIVLIDEIDVHLHPKWQRRIVPALEELFSDCQFIATTHSPFVIQATRRQQITSIEKNSLTVDMSGGNSIEDIAEEIQGIPVPQRSIRAEKLNAAAKQYFELLEMRVVNPRKVTASKLRAAERSYREASEPFSSDPAVHALLDVMTMEGKQ
ncbi:AAA family ATPase [Variovorax boronicumulans]|uniref:AAA family ATPase n=1 Tax=Variovorax boronicumulans TaxID=436515 RepID=UPI0033950404